MTAAAKPTADELDAAILAILRESRGEVMAWADIREQLPEAGFWAKVEALVRLDLAGKVDTIKVDGSDYVALALTLPHRVRRAVE